MITILGAGGAISNELLHLLAASRQPIRLVRRNASPVQGATEVVSADLSNKDQTAGAVAGSSLVFLLAGLKYDHNLWEREWPKIMANVIEACKRASASLVFFDVVYMYGKVEGAMTEDTPFNPCSKKGEIRARIATSLINEWSSGGLKGIIARAADFYGPHASNGIPNVLVFEPLSRNRKASWLSDDSVPHSFTYTVDAARGLDLLAKSESAWNQTWHLPTTSNPPTGEEFISMAARELGVRPRHKVLSGPVVRLAGIFKPTVGEVHEMLYEYASPYLFDSSKFMGTFAFSETSYMDGIRTTASAFPQKP
jgi:nucleoside-diphosphate-sugar epimerase